MLTGWLACLTVWEPPLWQCYCIQYGLKLTDLSSGVLSLLMINAKWAPTASMLELGLSPTRKQPKTDNFFCENSCWSQIGKNWTLPHVLYTKQILIVPTFMEFNIFTCSDLRSCRSRRGKYSLSVRTSVPFRSDMWENDLCMVSGGYLDIWTADGNFWKIII